MRTVRTKIYSFEELSNEAKNFAIENHKNSENELFMDFFKEDCINQIEEAGFYDNIKLQYDLGYSQGDGLSFSCDRVEAKTLLRLFSEILGEGKEITSKVIISNCCFENTGNTGNYCFASKSDIDFYIDRYDNDFKNCNVIVSKVLEKLENLYIDLCKKLEKNGYSEIEMQNSDEYISEYFISNEVEFLKNGSIFNL